MALASVGADGMPSQRMVLLKSYDAADSSSIPILRAAKASSSSTHPKAALLFHWKSLRREVRVEGPVTQTTPAEADDYFATRARGSQIGAWASDQSRPLESRFALEKRVAEFTTPAYHRHRAAPALLVGLSPAAQPDRILAGRRLPPARPFEYRRVAPDAAWTTRTLYP